MIFLEDHNHFHLFSTLPNKLQRKCACKPEFLYSQTSLFYVAFLYWLHFSFGYCTLPFAVCIYIGLIIENMQHLRNICVVQSFFLGGGVLSVSLFTFLLFFFLMCLIVKILNLMITDEGVSKSTLWDLNARDLSKQVESCNAQCGKILKGPNSLKV